MRTIYTTLLIVSLLLGCSGGNSSEGNNDHLSGPKDPLKTDAEAPDDEPDSDVGKEEPDSGAPGDAASANEAAVGVGAADAGSKDAASNGACASPTGPGKEQKTAVSADTVWKAADGPHRIPATGVTVTAKLSIEPCTTVLFDGQAPLLVTGAKGRLEALGTAQQPIMFAAETKGRAFKGLTVEAGATVSLAYATISGAGSRNGGALGLHGENAPRPIALLDHVTIQDSAEAGLHMDRGAQLEKGSNALTIAGSATVPVLIDRTALNSMVSGVYTGNREDVITVVGGPAMDPTFHNVGVPYRIRNGGAVAGLDVSGTLTIEAGVELRFENGSHLALLDGSIQAVGSMDKPIVIRGVDPLAGAWRGVYFAGKLDVTSRMEYVTVAHGGGYSSTVGYTCSMPRGANVPNGAIGFIATPAPTTSFIKNCRFEHSAGHGIARGWAGPATDFAETNTFLDIAWCQQSFPPPTTGGCPNPAPCVTE